MKAKIIKALICLGVSVVPEEHCQTVRNIPLPEKTPLSYQLLCCSGWPVGVLGGQLVAQGENKAVLTGHWKHYHVLGGTSLGLSLSSS